MLTVGFPSARGAPHGREDTVDVAARHRRIRVVLADDDESLLGVVRLTVLADGRFEVVGEAADGLQALAVVLAQQPDVVLLDNKMPRRLGSDIVGDIHQGSPGTKVLLWSSDPDVVRLGGRVGADATSTKDVDLGEVLEVLAALAG